MRNGLGRPFWRLSWLAKQPRGTEPATAHVIWQVDRERFVKTRTHRIGAVSYLNSVPLIHELSRLAPQYEVVLDVPSRLADRLAQGEMDVALIPAIEAAQSADYVVVSDACIGCFGPVWSVKLLSRVPLERIRTLALDEGSRTSVALAKILLQRRWGLIPTFSKLPLDVDFCDVSEDAVLVIGDRAMHSAKSGFRHQFDLGQCWTDWTNLPFVFAVWAAWPHADVDELSGLLSDSRDAGLDIATSIAKSHAAKYDLSVVDCVRYFTEFLNFRIGDQEKIGMALFCRYATEMGLLNADFELRFHDCEVA